MVYEPSSKSLISSAGIIASNEPAKINIVADEPPTEEEKQQRRKQRTDVNDVLKRLVDEAIERDVPPPPE